MNKNFETLHYGVACTPCWVEKLPGKKKAKFMKIPIRTRVVIYTAKNHKILLDEKVAFKDIASGNYSLTDLKNTIKDNKHCKNELMQEYALREIDEEFKALEREIKNSLYC